SGGLTHTPSQPGGPSRQERKPPPTTPPAPAWTISLWPATADRHCAGELSQARTGAARNCAHVIAITGYLPCSIAYGGTDRAVTQPQRTGPTRGDRHGTSVQTTAVPGRFRRIGPCPRI